MYRRSSHRDAGDRGPGFGVSKLSAVELKGASAIVTGGASGIGAATARQLADLGARVVIADMQADRGNKLAEEIGGVFVEVDVTNTEQIVDAVNTAMDLGPLRALVNSAGVGWAQRTIGKDGEFASAHDLDAYRKVIAACRKNNIHPGMGGVYEPKLLEKYIGMGMRFILGGGDMSFLMAGARDRASFLHGLKL